MNDIKSRVSALRKELSARGCDAFVLPLTDEFMGEYIPESENRLGWLTGFTGSAGTAVITADKAAFFTDGRYTLQAKDEVVGFDIFNSSELSFDSWLVQHVKPGMRVGVDPKLHTANAAKRLYKRVHGAGFQLMLLGTNPVDGIWTDRPASPASKVTVHPVEYAGKTAAEKCKEIGAELAAKQADILFVTANDSLCWLLNIRGADVPCTPFVRIYGALHKNGEAEIFIDPERLSAGALKSLESCVKIHTPDALQQWFEAQGAQKKTIAIDPAFASSFIYERCESAGSKILLMDDPCQLAKACKSEAEIAGARAAHRIDGLALTKFLHYLAKHHAGMTEQHVCDVLLDFRKANERFLEPSFPTISGSGANGAIVHYRVSDKTNKVLETDTLMLIDSGGQYHEGTTDVTRTVAIGTPTQEMKECFTRVLKGHIALATAVFPEGTNGMQLDALARQYLWKAGLDYDHGTGHGVGSFLSVHEGPQRISKKSSDVALRPGMILSNEPGYYKAGAFGIRIENLVVVQERFTKDGKRYFGFDTLTLAPIDTNLIVSSMLSEGEKQWLGDYQNSVVEAHRHGLKADELEWLERMVAF